MNLIRPVTQLLANTTLNDVHVNSVIIEKDILVLFCNRIFKKFLLRNDFNIILY